MVYAFYLYLFILYTAVNLLCVAVRISICPPVVKVMTSSFILKLNCNYKFALSRITAEIVLLMFQFTNEAHTVRVLLHGPFVSLIDIHVQKLPKLHYHVQCANNSKLKNIYAADEKMHYGNVEIHSIIIKTSCY